MNDEQLLELMNDQPHKGFTLLFERFYQEVCQHVYRYIPDHRICEDIAQELFTELWQKRESLTIKSSPGAYLHRMSVTRSLNYIRDHKRELFETEESLKYQDAKTVSPVEKMHAAQMSEFITRAIDELPPRCRMVFMLSRFEAMSNKEIANSLDISVKTVENQMTKALKSLKVALATFRNTGVGEKE